MPLRESEVKDLSILCSLVVSKRFARFLALHIAGKCKFCVQNTEFEKCLVMNKLKKQVNEIPIHANKLIYKKTLHLINSVKRGAYEIDIDSEESLKNQNKRAYYKNHMYLLTWLFETSNPSLTYTIFIYDNQDLRFVAKLGESIRSIIFVPSLFFIKYYLTNTLKYTTKVACLDLHDICITERILKTIGKYCDCLKEITGCVPIEKYSSFVLSLLYEDPETQKRRNKCAHTLEEIDFSYQDYSQKHSEVDKESYKLEGLRILFRHVLNLTNGGFFSTNLDNVLKALEHEPGLITKIFETTCESILTMNKVTKMMISFPKLKLLDASSIDGVEVLSLLHKCENMEEFKLRSYVDDVLFYKGIVSAKWFTLKRLELCGTLDELKLDIVANNLENLEVCNLDNCLDVYWDGETYFKSLKKFRIELLPNTSTADMHWFKSFSRTITSISVRHNKIIPLHHIPGLIDGSSYSQLTYVTISHLQFDMDAVKSAVENCPKLSHLGQFEKESEHEVNECKKYFEERKIQCNLYPL